MWKMQRQDSQALITNVTPPGQTAYLVWCWLIKLLTTTLSEPKFKFLKLLGKVMDLDCVVTSAQHEDLFMY